MIEVAENSLQSNSLPRILENTSDDTHTPIQHFLDRLARASDDVDARQIVRELLAGAAERILSLCGAKLKRSYRRLTKGPLNLQPEDLLGAVVERLIKAMRTVRPASVGEFFALVMKHVRWELNGLARKVDCEPFERLTTDMPAPAPKEHDEAFSPFGRRVLEAIDGLSPIDREIFNLVRLGGMTQFGAAEVLAISERTVQRRLGRIMAHLWSELGGREVPHDTKAQQHRPLRARFVMESATGDATPRLAA